MIWPAENGNGMLVYRCPELNRSGVCQAFSTRSCGNMALHTGDRPDDVIRRRRQFLDSQGLSIRQLVVAGQVHGTRVQVVTAAMAGAGAESREDAIPQTDALITREPGIVLGIFTADCLPLFLYDPETPAIAVIHAGWRGAINRIAALTLERMEKSFGTRPGQVWAAVGPGICRSCFEVDRDLAERFREADHQAVGEINSVFHVDLAGFIAHDLAAAGMNPGRIAFSGSCTACDPKIFYSYRADGGTFGRMMGIIGLKKSATERF
jgi:YfiH family protein